ncbi:hypothetical protein [Cupriavidus sp. CP313]
MNKRRIAITAAFVGIGLASVLAWSLIDAYLCDKFPGLCVPRPGTCVGIDICPADARMLRGLILLIPVPPVLFGVLGFLLCARVDKVTLLATALAGAVFAHWAVVFTVTRIIAL